MKEIIRTLTVGERQAALAIAICVTVAGLAMAVLGNGDPFGIHGYVVMAYGLIATIFLIRWYNLPPSSVDRADSYYDEPIKVAVVLSLAWAVIGMLFGLWAALQLAWPSLSFDLPWSSFGRIRPDHTTGVIFGFGGNALIGTSFYVVQRSSRARMPDQVAPLFVVIGYNLFCLLGATGYLMGVTKSKEYAEPEWYAGLWLVTVWIIYLIVYLRTLARRKEPHIYVANWYYLAFIVIVAILYIVNNLAVPISFVRAKSYPLFGGVQDAMTQWWYGHNAVAFFLTAGFLGMLYYFMPKRAGRPIYSYRISIISFWGITFFYIWVGSHHLHYTALPEWVQILGMSFSLMLLVPSWASAGNALMTLNGAWDKVRDDATLRFMMVAAVFYGLTTFEGSFMAIRPVNSLSHYTDWTIAHVHAGSLGWVAMITFGSLYAMAPWVWKKPSMYSPRLVEVHFWCALSGTPAKRTCPPDAGLTKITSARPFRDCLRHSPRDRRLALLCLLMLTWLRAAVIIYALFFVGMRPFPGFQNIAQILFTTEVGWMILIVGTIIGAIFAAFSFAISALRDHAWLYGGDLATLHETVWGGRQGHMPTWESRLSVTQRKILAMYIVDMRGKAQ